MEEQREGGLITLPSPVLILSAPRCPQTYSVPSPSIFPRAQARGFSQKPEEQDDVPPAASGLVGEMDPNKLVRALSLGTQRRQGSAGGEGTGHLCGRHPVNGGTPGETALPET